MDISEQELFERIVTGDVAAFEILYKSYHPRLFAYCRKFIDDPEIAKDLVQETFINLWENKENIGIYISIKSYLFRSIHNISLNNIRHELVKDKFTNYSIFKLKEAEFQYYSRFDIGLESIFYKEAEDIVFKITNTLPEQCKEVFLLSRNEGLKNQEIADKLNISVRTVENTDLSRA